MEKPRVLYGMGDWAVRLYPHVESEQRNRIVALPADAPYIRSDSFVDRPVVAFDAVRPQYPPERSDIPVRIGYRRMRDRKILFEKAKK